MKIITLLILSAFAISIIGCSNRNIKLNFIQFGDEHLNFENTSSKLPAAGITIIIENYKDNEYCERYIDSVVMKIGEAKKNNFSSYVIQLYKASEKTNLANLTANPKDLDRYSNPQDLIYDYYWSKGKLSSKLKFKKGKLIAPKGEEVKISDIP